MVDGTQTDAPGGPSAPQAVPDLPPALARVARCITDIMRRRREFLTAKVMQRHGKKPNSIYASRIPDCDRQGVYEFTNPGDKVPFDWKLQAKFDQGNATEDIYKAQLREIGMEIVEDQAPLSDDMREKYGIGAYIDIKCKFENTRIPIEIKQMAPFIYDKMVGVEFDDLSLITMGSINAGLESLRRFWWTRKYLRQCYTYMLGTAQEAMMMALTDGRGAWKFCLIPLDYSEGEKVLAIAQRIKTHVAAGTQPERISYDHEVCGICAFMNICIPDIKQAQGIQHLDNAKTEALLLERHRVEESGKKFNSLDRKAKKMLETLEEGVATLGDFIITKIVKPSVKVEFPNEAEKMKYQVPSKRVTVKIERFVEPDADSVYLGPKRLLTMED